MHSCVYVIINTTGNIESSVARALAPFDESLKVRPYKLHLSASTVVAMARYYNIPESDHTGLIAKMNDWLGYPGGKDQVGLYAMCSNNPNGKWDWYEIGGRYNGWIQGSEPPRPRAGTADFAQNTIAASDLLKAKDFAKRVPYALVTPHGEWIERSSVESTASGWFLREEPRPTWTGRVKAILRTFSDHRVVCIDAHS